jgi:hypothetical protein
LHTFNDISSERVPGSSHWSCQSAADSKW